MRGNYILDNNMDFWVGIFAIPLGCGIFLIIQYFRNQGNDRKKYLLAAIFTLKPLLATPIWLWILATRKPPLSEPPILDLLLTILPGAGLTLLIILAFRSLYTKPVNEIAKLLLIFDCVRWLNSFLLLASGLIKDPIVIICVIITGNLGRVIPSFYGIFALVITRNASNLKELQPTHL